MLFHTCNYDECNMFLLMSNWDELNNALLGEMKKRNWNNADVFRATGISEAQISRVLNNLNPPGNSFCIRIAPIIGVTEKRAFEMGGIHKPERIGDQELEDANYKLGELRGELKSQALRTIELLFREQERELNKWGSHERSGKP